MNNTVFSLLDDVSPSRDEPIAFWIIGLGEQTTKVCLEIHEQTTETETTQRTGQDNLGLAKYIGNETHVETRVVTNGVPITCIADVETLAQVGRPVSESFVTLDYTRECGQRSLHSYLNYPGIRHSRSCLKRYYEGSRAAASLESLLMRNRPAIDGGFLIPIVLVQSEDANTVLLKGILSSLSRDSSRTAGGPRATAPIVVLLQSDYPHRLADTEGLINSLAIQAEILNWRQSISRTKRGLSSYKQKQEPDVVSIALTARGLPFEQSVARFIREHLLKLQNLKAVLSAIHQNERLVERQEVAAASIAKVQITNDGYDIPSIDDADTPFEDDQNHLLERNEVRARNAEQVENVLHSMCWLSGNLADGLPMRASFLEHVLTGYVVDSASKIEKGQSPISLNSLLNSIVNAMVMYGPLGFLESERFDRSLALDTVIADQARAIGSITSHEQLSGVFQSESGRSLRDILEKKRERLIQRTSGSQVSSFSSGDMTSRDLAELDLIKQLLDLHGPVSPGGLR